MHFKTVFFDLDGTLTDPKEGILNSVRYALSAMKWSLPPDTQMTDFIGPPLFEAFFRIAGMSEEEAVRAVSEFRTYFSTKGILENRLFDGIPALLATLRERGIGVALATGKPEVFAKRILEHFGIAEYFTTVSGIPLDDERGDKVEVLLRAMRAEGVEDPRTCLMVGDRRYDVSAAHACGMPACGVLFGYGSHAELSSAGAEYLFADIPALADFLLAEGN